MSINIRPISNSMHDITQLTGLMNQWDDLPHELSIDYIVNKLQKISTMKNSIVLVAEDNESNLAGYAFLTEVVFLGMEPFIELQSILVNRVHRRQGIGKALMNASEEWARNNGFHEIVLSSRIHLNNAHKFYEGLGYKTYKQSYFFKKKI